MSYPSHYYYAFLCLFVLLFFQRANTLRAFVPLCLLLTFNIAALVTDSFGPSPIVFYTLLNIYLFLCLAAILAFELYVNVFGNSPDAALAELAPVAPIPRAPRRNASAKRGRTKKA